MPEFRREIEIDVDVETIWQIINDPNTWPHWFPAVDAVSNVRGSGKGMQFNWQDDHEQGSGEVIRYEANERLDVMTQVGDDQDLHSFEVKADRGFLGLGKADGCEVTYTLDTLVGGGFIGRFIAGGNPLDTRRVKSAMERLKRYAEQRG